MSRVNTVKVSLSDQELARLDELRGELDRAVFMRSLLYEPPDGSEIATHSEALGLLTQQARDGKVAASIALERALRQEGQPAAATGELERLLGD